MVGFLSAGPVMVAPYAAALQYQAEHGFHAPHSDGWGFCVYDGNRCDLHRSVQPAFRETYEGPAMATAALFHARKASSHPEAISWQDAHPFTFQAAGRFWSFAHNGTIRGELPREWGAGTDSQIYADLLARRLEQREDLVDALRSVVRLLEGNAQPDSLNALLVTQDELLVVHSSDPEHTLFSRSSPSLFEASTEPLASTWSPVPDRTILDARRTETGITAQSFGL